MNVAFTLTVPPEHFDSVSGAEIDMQQTAVTLQLRQILGWLQDPNSGYGRASATSQRNEETALARDSSSAFQLSRHPCPPTPSQTRPLRITQKESGGGGTHTKQIEHS